MRRRYNGTYLAGYGDAVVVTFNYRIGILGFLDFSFLGEDCDPNCGLFDVIEALRWVHDNIDAFGGDPDNITVFGQSAGGTTTATLATLPAAQGLFHKCIVMSGGPTLLQGKEEGRRTAGHFLDLCRSIRQGNCARYRRRNWPQNNRRFVHHAAWARELFVFQWMAGWCPITRFRLRRQARDMVSLC